MKTTLIKLSVFCVIYLVSFVAVRAQQTDYKYHSIFIYNFTKYLQWPAANSSGDFVIGVVGNSPIVSELEKMAESKTVGNRRIVVKRFASAEEIASCQMLFVPHNQNRYLAEITAKARKNSILVITESPGLAHKGSNINFVIKENKWRFELNKKATDEANIKVSQELLSLSIPVE